MTTPQSTLRKAQEAVARIDDSCGQPVFDYVHLTADEWNAIAEIVRALAAQPGGGFVVPCRGADCGSTNYRFHSAACFAEHEATVAAAAAADQGSAK